MRLWLEKWIIRLTGRMNLRRKILALHSLILLVPSLILVSITLIIVIHSFHNSYVTTVDDSVKQTAINVDYSKQSYELLAIRTATDSEMIARLGREYDDMTQIMDTVNYLDRNFLITSRYLPGIVDFRIYHTNNTLVQDGQLLWQPEDRMLSGIDERTWYKKTIAAPTLLLWSNAPNNPSQIVLTSKILNSAGKPVGMVYILLNYNVVFGDLLKYPFNDGGSLYIVDESKRILASTEKERVGSRIISKDWPEDYETIQDDKSPIYDLTHTQKLMTIEPISSDWYVVALTHMKYMDTQSRTLLCLIAGTTVALLLLSVFLVMTIVKNIVVRIHRLGIRMSDLSRGEFDVTIHNKVHDELGGLENMFNLMSERLGILVEDITRTSLMEREQAFKAMQAQINPHFIYNSLSLLRWRALDAQDEEQVRIIDSLTTFYRLALNNQVSVIPIREEIEHVKAYLEVQQLRFPGKVRIKWELDEQVLDFYTIKMLLQPIVENCYSHGAITRKKESLIKISVQQDDGCIIMSVFDNGQGITRDTLSAIEAGTHVGSGNGFGTANIKERLSLYFGDEATFAMDSEAGEWTQVSIVIPVCSVPPTMRRINKDAESNDR
ncbi:sensor histidine kinase [Paenibacillus puldeungensis]|uniref:Sensor histidine kinase n=1 Tax=Paenibacillus puldeungensis TaxID=696536 RepID=A0ABW3RRE4_9BACL